MISVGAGWKMGGGRRAGEGGGKIFECYVPIVGSSPLNHPVADIVHDHVDVCVGVSETDGKDLGGECLGGGLC